MPLMVSYHPTYAFFHNPYEWGAFSVDLDRFSRLVKGRLRARPRIIENPKKSDLLALMHEPFVTVDIETAPASDEREIEGVKPGYTGKQPTRCQLRLLGFGTAEVGMSFRLHERTDLIATAKKLLAEPKLTKVFQNGYYFDIPVLERYGFKVR